MLLNSYGASIIPYCVFPGRTVFLFEQKSADYVPPFFQHALAFLGGNWQFGLDTDKSPYEVMLRELREEFWQAEEEEEIITDSEGHRIFGGGGKAVHVPGQYCETLRPVVSMLSSKARYAGSYISQVRTPIVRKDFTYGLSIFLAPLSVAEFDLLCALMASNDGKLTTDNLRHNSNLALLTVKEINTFMYRFAWGQEKVLNALLHSFHIEPKLLITNGLTSVQPLSIGCKDLERGPTFAEIQAAGCSFIKKEKYKQTS